MSVLIKRYQNRKLYNTATKRYITLAGIKELIADNHEVRVIENSTGTDITSITLSQIVYEIGKKQNGILPVRLLADLVQLAGRNMLGIQQDVYFRLNTIRAHDIEIERRVNLLIERGDLTRAAGALMMEKLVYIPRIISASDEPAGIALIDLYHVRQIQTKNDFYALSKKVDDLYLRLETYKASVQALHKS